jgi:hypothetical protein
MVDRQFAAARMVADPRRRMGPPLLARIADTRSSRRPPQLSVSAIPASTAITDQPSGERRR